MAAHRYWRLLCHSHQTDASAFAIAELIGRTISGGAQQLTSSVGSEIIVNGGFSTATDWTLTGATISGGVLTASSASNFADAAVPPLTIGQSYQFSIDYNKTAGSKLRIANGATGGTSIVYISAVLANGAGTLTGSFVATGTHFRIEADTATYSGTIDNVSCKPIAGVAAASGVTGSQAAALAFDGNAATYWQAGAGTDGQWISFDLGLGNAKDIIEIVITARNDTSFYQAPTYAEWQYSDDNVTWTPYIYVYGSAYTAGSSQTFSGGRQYISKTNLAVVSRKASGAIFSKTNLAIASRPAAAWAVISKTNLAVTSGPVTGYTMSLTPGVYAIAGSPLWPAGGGRNLKLRFYDNEVDNGYFNVDTSGWTVSDPVNTSFVSVDGVGVLTQNGSANAGYAYQGVALIEDEAYQLSVKLIPDHSTLTMLQIGTSPGGNQIGYVTLSYTGVLKSYFGTVKPVRRRIFRRSSTGPGDIPPVLIQFVAEAPTIYISLATTGQILCTASFDDVTIERAAAYTVTGSPITLTKTGRMVSVTPGVYSVTGAAISMRVTRRMPIDSGSYNSVRPDIGLKVGRKLAIDPGGYTITGTDVSMAYIAGRFIHLPPGAYAAVGGDIRLLVGRKMSVDPSTYALTGSTIGWIYRRALKIASAVYTSVGTAVGLLLGRRLPWTPGSYVIDGTDINPILRRMTIDSGSYAETGSPIGLRVGRVMPVAPGTYTIGGTAIGLGAQRRLAFAPGAYALTGTTVRLLVGRKIVVAGGVYTVAGAPLALKRGYTVHLTPGVYTISPQPIGLRSTRTMHVAGGTYHINVQDIGLTPTWRERGPRIAFPGGFEYRYEHVAAQNRGVTVGRQVRSIAVEPAAQRYAAVEPRDKEPEGGSMLQWPEKDPNEVLDYELDWAKPDDPRLLAGESLITSVWTVVEGDVMIDSSDFTPQGLSTVWLSGGSDSTKCVLLNRVTTSAGRTYDKSIVLRVRTH